MKKHVSRIYMAVIFFFLYSPIAIMALFSFNASKSRTVWTGFTLDWYAKLFHNETIINSLGVTIIAAVVVYAALVLALKVVTREDVLILPKGEKIAKLLRLK